MAQRGLPVLTHVVLAIARTACYPCMLPLPLLPLHAAPAAAASPAEECAELIARCAAGVPNDVNGPAGKGEAAGQTQGLQQAPTHKRSVTRRKVSGSTLQLCDLGILHVYILECR